MSATDELRRLLDERGVEWWDDSSIYGTRRTVWTANGVTYVAAEVSGRLKVSGYLTPEQAIEDTLGRMDKVFAVGGIIAQAECRDVCSSASEFTCSACDFNCDLTSWISLFDGDDGRHRHHHHGTPNYCPNCGRKVVDA